MAQVRWGLLSTANINRRLIPAIQAEERGVLTAVASRSTASAESYAAEWEIPHAFGSYEEMLASDTIDAVYIGLPNHLHAEWAIKAMRQGKHVLCEKPFALTLAEVDAMFDVAQETGMVLAEAFMYRHHPQTKIARQLIEDGDLGDLIQVNATFNFAFRSRENIRLVPEYGGGSLWDVGVYPLSFAQYIFQSAPDWVMGSQWVGPTQVDESFSGLLQYGAGANARVAQISCAFRSPFHTRAEVIGTDGRLVLTKPFVGLDQNRSMILYRESGEKVMIQVPEKELYLGEVEDMHAAILDGLPPYISPLETRDHVRTILALYASARSGQVVHLTES
jgi:xylose dehydrogenase (NAD/NADP)